MDDQHNPSGVLDKAKSSLVQGIQGVKEYYQRTNQITEEDLLRIEQAFKLDDANASEEKHDFLNEDGWMVVEEGALESIPEVGPAVANLVHP